MKPVDILLLYVCFSLFYLYCCTYTLYCYQRDCGLVKIWKASCVCRLL